MGDGVDVISIQYDGQPEALGYFTEETGPLGFSEGIVLTTGHAATDASGVGTNEPASANAQVGNMSTVRDNNLETIVPYLKSDGTQNIHDVAKYTITFVPKGDKIKFRYVFASEEYLNSFAQITMIFLDSSLMALGSLVRLSEEESTWQLYQERIFR